MSRDIDFDGLEIGEQLGPITYPVKEGHVQRYTEDWEDPNPLYLEDSPFGGPVVPPAYRAGLDSFDLLGSKHNARATVGVTTAHKFLQPLAPGQEVSAEGILAGKFIRRGIEYVVIEYWLANSRGERVRESVDRIALSVERVDRPDTPGYPDAPARPEAVAEPLRDLTSTRHHSYQRALVERKWGRTSIHNDDYTRSKGYAGALTSSYVLCGYMSEVMVNAFGAGYIAGGEISLRFINGGVQQGDLIECFGQVMEMRDEDDAHLRAQCQLWMVKKGELKVVVGSGSARVAR